jgi:hypothetical protein
VVRKKKDGKNVYLFIPGLKIFIPGLKKNKTFQFAYNKDTQENKDEKTHGCLKKKSASKTKQKKKTEKKMILTW